MLAMVAEYEKRRQIMIDGFKKIGLPLYEPEGAFMYSPVLNKQGSRVWNLLKTAYRRRSAGYPRQQLRSQR